MSSIRTFDQLTDQEVTELTEEQFKHFCALEMMAKGFIIPKAPPEVTEKAPKLPTKTYFRPKLGGYTSLGIVFETAAQAAAFLGLHPIREDRNYNAGYDCAYASEAPEISIDTCELSSQADYEAAVADLVRINSAKNQYQKDKAEYDKQSKAATDAVQWLVDRRSKCLLHKRLLDQIRSTNTEYVALCEGNERTARNFLGKRYLPCDIQEALGELVASQRRTVAESENIGNDYDPRSF